MNKKFGFIAKNIIRLRMERVLMNVLAEEPTPTDPPRTEPNPADPPKPTVNFEDLVARARKEEKDKLYPQIEGLKKDVKSLTETNNGHLLTIEGKDKEIETLKATIKSLEDGSSKSDSEAVTTLKKEVKDLKKTIKDMEDNSVDVQALEDKIKGEYEVKLYREQKLRESSELIEELVTGTTKEEIDKSFDIAKQRYAGIKNSVVSTAMDTIPGVNVSGSSINKGDFKVEDLAKLDVRSPEYRELRKKLGLR